jgi:type VI protein secretion system component VasK
VSNEGLRVLPGVTATGPTVPEVATLVLGIDGQAVAWTHGHGASMTWFGSRRRDRAGLG